MKLYRQSKTEAWISFEESGIRDHKLSYDNTPIVGYEEVTDIVYIHELYHITRTCFCDYINIRLLIKEIVGAIPFENLTEQEKMIVCEFCAFDDATIVGYYMSIGFTQAQAITKHKVNRANDIDLASKACQQRAETSVVKYIVIKYLTESSASAFLDAIRNYMEDYKRIAHLGLNYGQSREGLMDYIEATNAYENGGLSQYTFIAPYTYAECRDELKNYLLYGKTPDEYNQFSIV